MFDQHKRTKGVHFVGIESILIIDLGWRFLWKKDAGNDEGEMEVVIALGK